jgi:thiazole/oxazole-forming peptide maturase SagC family component
MANDPTLPVYRLADGVRVHRSGDEIRFRKGVWSHQEATVRLIDQPSPVVEFLNAVYEALVRRGDADLSDIGRDQGASAEELSRYQGLLESLRQQQFLRDVRQKDSARMVGALLGGIVSGFEHQIAPPRPALFFTDSQYARTSAAALAREMSMPLDVMDPELIRAMATADLTSRTDAVEYIEALTRYEAVLRPYTCVLGCVASPNMSFLRNLNRLLIRLEKPLILGLIDGPFITALSTLATDTGCFECFEQRMLARLEDTAIYQQFVDATAGVTAASGAWTAPQLHALISAVISEGYLYATVGMMRLAGRVVNIYLPLLEIQVQDLLRVPYCPACGYIARAQMNEMYTSTKRLVDDMLHRITVEG